MKLLDGFPGCAFVIVKVFGWKDAIDELGEGESGGGSVVVGAGG